MKDLIRKTWVKFFEERSRRERLQKTAISMVLIAAVVSATVFVAVTPAHTLEVEASLSCGKEEHVHDESCFTEQSELICGLEESAEEHTHTDECYGSTSVLTCTLEEHSHGPECYERSQSEEVPEEENKAEDIPETQPAGDNEEDVKLPEADVEGEELPEEEIEENEIPEEVEEIATPSDMPEATPSNVIEGDREYSVTLSDGLVITMTGPADAFPEGTLTMRAEELHEDDADYEAALGLLAGETEDEVILEQRIFDICLLDENGNEVQPVKEVRVTFSQVLNGEEKGVQIHHLDTEENVAESIDTFVDGEDVIMETGHFSYYSMTLAGSGVATIDDKSYDTLTNAVKAVKSGETIVLQKDVEEDIKLSKAVNFTIDVNGYTWTGKSSDMITFSTNDVELTLTGGEKGGTLQAVSGKRIVTADRKNNCTLEIINLNLQGNETKSGNGGLIYAVASSDSGFTVTMVDSTFTSGRASIDGGAIYIKDGNLTAENCTFEGNIGAKSGAVYLNGGSYSCSASFSNCRFLNNEGGNGGSNGGGAICLYGSNNRVVSLIVDKCEFTGNTSKKNGGAIYFASNSKNVGTLTITESAFSKNQSTIDGGAVYINNGITTISGTQFLANSTGAGNGGGLFVRSNSSSYKCVTNIQDTTLEGNQAVQGGAVYTDMALGQSLRLSKVTAERNTASKVGGAIFDYTSTSNTKVEIVDCNIWNNTAGYTAGGIFAKSKTVHIIGESIIKENTAKGEGLDDPIDYPEIIGGVYLKNPSSTSLRLDETSYVYKNKTQNESVIPGGDSAEIYLYAYKGVKLEGVFAKLEKETEGNTITDSGSVYTLAKYQKKDHKDYYYYNSVMEPERIYLDPAGTHTHKTSDFIAATLKEAVEHARETRAEKIYVCSPVSLTSADEAYLNDETITFTRCDENRNYLFQIESGNEVTFEKTRINGALVDADYALVLVAKEATLNIKGDTVIEAGKNVNAGSNGLGGGGLRVSGTLNMSGGIIQKNQANGSGGGIYALYADLNFTGGSILNNETLKSGDGGGIYMYGGDLSIIKGEDGSRTLIKGNKAVSLGGGILLYREAHARIECADILNNAQTLKSNFAGGGGIHVYSGATLEMKNLYMTDNYQLGNSISRCALYSCDTGSMAIFTVDGAFIADNNSEDSPDILSIERGNTHAYISSHVLGGSDANWSVRKGAGAASNKLDLWGIEKTFSVYGNPEAGAKETAKAIAESDGVVMTGNWGYACGTAIANNGTLIVGTEEMSLTVNKVWKDIYGNIIADTSNYDEVPESLRVYLMKSLNGAVPELATEFTDAEAQLNKGNKWSHTWERLGDSEAVKWSVEEDKDDATGFDAVISPMEQDTKWKKVVQKHYIITITNTEKSELEIAVKKKWIDQNNANGWRPENITAELWRSDNSEKPFKTQTLNDGNQWFYKFEKLPKYDSAGKKYTYSVKEIPVENYTSEISEPQKEAQGITYTITNTAYGKAQIKKTLDSYNETLGGALFVFDVKAVLEDEVIFNDVFTADFKAPGTQTIDIGEFPVGTKITVEEVYSGSSYGLTVGDKQQNLTIQLNSEGTGTENVLAEYLNTYDNKLVPGAGVRNHYERNNSSWTGSQAVN